MGGGVQEAGVLAGGVLAGGLHRPWCFQEISHKTCTTLQEHWCLSVAASPGIIVVKKRVGIYLKSTKQCEQGNKASGSALQLPNSNCRGSVGTV